jgi:hypothetical protein
MGNHASSQRNSDYKAVSPPPPYDGEIKASDVPQWLWSNQQCRDWLTEVLVEKCNKDREAATKNIGHRRRIRAVLVWD